MKTVIMLLCAWVLWVESIALDGKPPHSQAYSGATSKEECERTVPGAIDQLRGLGEVGKVTDGTFFYKAGETVSLMRLVCLPDTVDPRPRGKD